MSSSSSRWSASPPTGFVQPAWKAPQVASSSTSDGVRPQRPISRIDCWANTGLIAAPTALSARTWPGVASPSRSPKPAEVCRPKRDGVSQGSADRSARAFSELVSASSRSPPSTPSTVPAKPRMADSSGATATSRLAPSADRSSQ